MPLKEQRVNEKDPRPRPFVLTGDRCRIRQHADSTLNFSQITAGYNGRWLIVDADFETCRTPVDELNGSLGFNRGNGCVNILGHHVTSVQQTARHVFT